jgi:hypothetical protein
VTCLLEGKTIFIILVRFISSSLWAEEATDALENLVLPIKLHIRVNREAHLPDDENREHNEMELEQGYDLLILESSKSSLQIVLGAACWVEQAAFVFFEYIWLEVLGNYSPY